MVPLPLSSDGRIVLRRHGPDSEQADPKYEEHDEVRHGDISEWSNVDVVGFLYSCASGHIEESDKGASEQ